AGQVFDAGVSEDAIDLAAVGTRQVPRVGGVGADEGVGRRAAADQRLNAREAARGGRGQSLQIDGDAGASGGIIQGGCAAAAGNDAADGPPGHEQEGVLAAASGQVADTAEGQPVDAAGVGPGDSPGVGDVGGDECVAAGAAVDGGSRGLLRRDHEGG